MVPASECLFSEQRRSRFGWHSLFFDVLHLIASYRRRPRGRRRYSINVTLEECCVHRVIPAGEELNRHVVENLYRADALLFGRLTHETMEAASEGIQSLFA